MTTYKTTINGKALTSNNLVDHYNFIKDNQTSLIKGITVEQYIANNILKLSCDTVYSFIFPKSEQENKESSKDFDAIRKIVFAKRNNNLTGVVDNTLLDPSNSSLLHNILERCNTYFDTYKFEKVG